jgi:SAM-dependent methyltransferase
VFDNCSVVAVVEGSTTTLPLKLPSRATRLEVKIGLWPLPSGLSIGGSFGGRLVCNLRALQSPDSLRIGSAGLMVESSGEVVASCEFEASPLASGLSGTPVECSALAFDLEGEVIDSAAFEIRFLPSADVLHAFQSLATSTQASGDVAPLLSIARFFEGLFEWRDYFSGSTVVVSGCGTGGELIALGLLGADSVCGIEMEGAELELAKAATSSVPDLTVMKYTDGLPGVPMCDVVMSRHVIEHVPKMSRGSYFDEIASVLKPGGYLLIEAPNHLCPMEPHTGIRFFHWLSEEQQDSAIAYFEEKARWDEAFGRELHLLQTLRGHSNGSLSEIEELTSANFEIIETRTFDTSFVASEGVAHSGDVIQAVLRRKLNGVDRP